MTSDALVFLIVLLIVNLFGFIALGGLLLFLSRDTTKIPELLSRVGTIEGINRMMVFNAQNEEEVQEIWRTADGKYQANNLEDLLTVMVNDENSPLTAEEIEALKSVFRKISGEESDSDDRWKNG